MVRISVDCVKPLEAEIYQRIRLRDRRKIREKIELPVERFHDDDDVLLGGVIAVDVITETE